MQVPQQNLSLKEWYTRYAWATFFLILFWGFLCFVFSSLSFLAGTGGMLLGLSFWPAFWYWVYKNEDE